jgi:ribosome maturation factor RimP
MAEPILAELELEPVRVRIMGGRHPILQIMIERKGGAMPDVEDCASLSRMLSPILEAQDPISEAYRLEVSSPGIDRPLTRVGDFGRWVGHVAKVELVIPLDGRRRFKGTIVREGEDGAVLELDDESELIAKVEDMTKASLILTDELIDAAMSSGNAPPQPGDEDFDGLETDETETEDEESGV